MGSSGPTGYVLKSGWGGLVNRVMWRVLAKRPDGASGPTRWNNPSCGSVNNARDASIRQYEVYTIVTAAWGHPALWGGCHGNRHVCLRTSRNYTILYIQLKKGLP